MENWALNKKVISIIIALLLALGLCGCIEPVEKPDPTKPLAERDSGLAIANPVKEMSRQELIENCGIDLGAPEGAEDMVYSLIDLSESLPVAQLRFKLDGYELCLRAQAMNSQSMAGDISGLYYEWELTRNTFVNFRYAVVNICGDIGYIKWVDAVPGIQYSLSMTEGAEEKLLVELAERVFYPVQDEA